MRLFHGHLCVLFAMVLSAAACAGAGGSQSAPADAGTSATATAEGDEAASPAHLTARPDRNAKTTVGPGVHPLGLTEGARDGVLVVPKGLQGRVPLLVMMHGAGGDSQRTMRKVIPLAEKYRFVAMLPDSRDISWDAIRGGYGVDVEFIDEALRSVFGQVRVDPKRIALGGFSDGGTYALSLGRANGDLFAAIIGMSPGFIVDAPPVGKPRVFMAHGTRDGVLPIDQTSRQIVPRLESEGYDVEFVEFEGKHDLVPATFEKAIQWWLEPAA